MKANTDLPAILAFTCPKCSSQFSIRASELGNVIEVTCPACASGFNIYDGLSSNDRRRIYFALRDEIEGLIYQRKYGAVTNWPPPADSEDSGQSD